MVNGDGTNENYNNLNWQKMLCPSTTNIQKLGSLMKETSKMTDMALCHQRGLQAQSDSLRTSLLQISDVCYAAFNTAHNTMDRIRLLALNVPDCMESTSKIEDCQSQLGSQLVVANTR